MGVQIAGRAAATLIGSFAFTWGFVAAGVAALVVLGVDFHEAEVALMLLAFLVFLPLFLWAFASPRRKQVWTTLAAGVLLLPAAAWALQNLVT